ncbi:hypothetical protein J6590_037864 [Homalodisca vitripennis]|nr:hypothetical protein J6590_037864 [Homalodisca vitripennis]
MRPQRSMSCDKQLGYFYLVKNFSQRFQTETASTKVGLGRHVGQLALYRRPVVRGRGRGLARRLPLIYARTAQRGGSRQSIPPGPLSL